MVSMIAFTLMVAFASKVVRNAMLRIQCHVLYVYMCVWREGFAFFFGGGEELFFLNGH